MIVSQSREDFIRAVFRTMSGWRMVTIRAPAGIFRRELRTPIALNLLLATLVAAAAATTAGADDRAGSNFSSAPLLLTLENQPESVYAPPEPPTEEQGINQGAVHVDLSVRYMTDYIFRGLDRSDGVGLSLNPTVPPVDDAKTFGNEDAPNLQFDAKLSFDLGKLPHPYIGLFTNVYNSDPISRFQEVRPIFGAEWTIRPLILEGGHQTFF